MHRQKPSEEIKWTDQEFPIVVVAENIHSPANVGLLVRACECFGIKKLYFTGPFSNTDSNRFRKTARAAEKYLSIKQEETSHLLLKQLRSENYHLIACEITDKSTSLHNFKIENCEKIALILGSERHGVTDGTLRLVDEAVHIDQYGRTGSLNIAMALSVVLYEFTNQLR
jgi:tRNA G18 (ribose-2'-O)-methylase SpoU